MLQSFIESLAKFVYKTSVALESNGVPCTMNSDIEFSDSGEGAIGTGLKLTFEKGHTLNFSKEYVIDPCGSSFA